MITEQLVSKINNAKRFTVLDDELTDIFEIEMFTLCIRYLDISIDSI